MRRGILLSLQKSRFRHLWPQSLDFQENIQIQRMRTLVQDLQNFQDFHLKTPTNSRSQHTKFHRFHPIRPGPPNFQLPHQNHRRQLRQLRLFPLKH